MKAVGADQGQAVSPLPLAPSTRFGHVPADYETVTSRIVLRPEPWGSSVIFQDSEGNQLHLGSR